MAGELPDSEQLATVFIDPSRSTRVSDMCQAVVSQMSDQIHEQIKVDLKDYRWDRQVTFTGRATMKLMPDRTRIGRLRDGHWTDLGTFDARLQ